MERLYYLKTLVKGETSAALSTLPLTAENYSTAWNLLQRRFDNCRLLVQDHTASTSGETSSTAAKRPRVTLTTIARDEEEQAKRARDHEAPAASS